MKLLALSLAPLTMLVAVAGCAAPTDDDAEAADATEDELRKGSAEQWVYNGPLPHLERPEIVVSQTAHTARVTGYLPADFRGSLPYYVDSMEDGGRTKIAVVYPIATGSSVNSQPASYNITRLSPWVPTNEKATWGGFPFIPYDRGIAFHGPITAKDGEWRLIRGAVSHGCNRMQGEHVVELANLIGADMTSRVWTGSSMTGLKVPVTVLRKADEWNGKNVDVDYPAQASVKRPTTNVAMFRSWSADQLASFVCPLNKKDVSPGSGAVPTDYCARRHRNTIDPMTGR
jgi:hypothetical protein